MNVVKRTNICYTTMCRRGGYQSGLVPVLGAEQATGRGCTRVCAHTALKCHWPRGVESLQLLLGEYYVDLLPWHSNG